MFKELTKNVKYFRLHCWFIQDDTPVSEMEMIDTKLDHLTDELYRLAENNGIYMNSVLIGSSVQTRVEGPFNSVMYYTLTPLPSSAPEAPYREPRPKAKFHDGDKISGM